MLIYSFATRTYFITKRSGSIGRIPDASEVKS